MQIVIYTLVGIALYFGADWVLNHFERVRGERFKHREIIYFAIILTLALVTFYLINHVSAW